MTEIGSVAVVAVEDISPINEPFVGDKGAEAGTICSTGGLLTDPAFELAVLCGALATPVAPLYIADPSEYNDENERRLLLPSVSLGALRLASGRLRETEGSEGALCNPP